MCEVVFEQRREERRGKERKREEGRREECAALMMVRIRVKRQQTLCAGRRWSLALECPPYSCVL